MFVILSFSSIICVDIQDGSCKVLSWYFSKIFSILRYWGHRPTPNIFMFKYNIYIICIVICFMYLSIFVKKYMQVKVIKLYVGVHWAVDTTVLKEVVSFGNKFSSEKIKA